MQEEMGTLTAKVQANKWAQQESRDEAQEATDKATANGRRCARHRSWSHPRSGGQAHPSPRSFQWNHWVRRQKLISLSPPF